jgi:hypothetical protein
MALNILKRIERACINPMEAVASLLEPGAPLDLDILSTVASSVDDLSQPAAVRESAVAVLWEFATRPDCYLFCEQVLASGCPDIAKFAVLSSLESVARECWKQLDPDRKHSIRSCLIACIGDSAISHALVPKISSVLLHAIHCEYPDEWPTFLDDVIGYCHDCRRWFRFLADFLADTFFLPVATFSVVHRNISDAVARVTADIAAHFPAIVELILLIFREPYDSVLVQSAGAAFLRLIRFFVGPEFFQSKPFEEICALLQDRPDLAVETIPVLTESLASLYVPQERQDSVRGLFVMIMHALEKFIAPVLKTAAIMSNDSFLSSVISGLSCLVSHYFPSVFDAEMAPVFFRMIEFVIAITDAADLDVFESYLIPFWNVIAEREELFHSAEFAPFFPVLLDRFLHKMPSPFVHSSYQNADGEIEIHFTEQSGVVNSFLIRQIVAHNRESALGLMETVLQECAEGHDFEGICRICYALGAFVNPSLSKENCEFAVLLTRSLLSIYTSVESFDDRATIAIGIGVFFADISPMLVSCVPLLRVVVDQLLDFMVMGNSLLQEATVFSLSRILRSTVVNRERAGTVAVSQLFNDLFDRIPQILQSLSQYAIRSFFSLLQQYQFTGFTPRSDRLITLVSDRLEELMSSTDFKSPAVFEELGTYFLVLATSSALYSRQATPFFQAVLPRYFDLSKYILNVLQQCSVDSPLFESIRKAKQDLLFFFGKAVRIPFGDLFTTDFFLFFIDDFFESEPTFRSPASLTLFCSAIQNDSIWNQRPMLEQLFVKVIAPVESMLQSSFEEFAAFSVPLSNLLIDLVEKRLPQLREMDDGSISYVFQILLFQITMPSEGQMVLINRMAILFDFVQLAHGPEAAEGLLTEFGFPILEVIFEMIFRSPKTPDVLGLSEAMHVILGHSFFQQNSSAFCDLIYKVAPECRPEIAQRLIIEIYAEKTSAYLETLRSAMLEVRSIRPRQSLEIFSRAKADVIEAIRIGSERVRQEQAAAAKREEQSALPLEFGALPAAIQGFSIGHGPL